VPVGVPAAPSFPADVSVHAATSLAPADISVPAVSPAHAAGPVSAETVVHTAESHVDDPLTASEHVSTEPTVAAHTPSSSRTRRKHIAKKRVTHIVDIADAAMIKFDSDSDSNDDLLPYAPYRTDLQKLLGAVDELYQKEDPDTFALLLWRLYPRAQVHVLETVDGRVIHMFVDVSYPLSVATLEGMLKHGLEVPKLLVSRVGFSTTSQMVFSSPWLTAEKELTHHEGTALWLVQGGTALGKDKSNPLIVGSLLKTTWSSIHHLLTDEVLTSPEQTATGKDVSNPFMAVMVCQKPLGYFSSPMIPVPRAELVLNPPGLLIPAGFWLLLMLVAAGLVCSCCWNKDAILELTSADLSRILKLTMYVVHAGRIWMAIDTNVTAPVNITEDVLLSHYLEPCRFLNETAPQVKPPTEGQPSNAQAVQAVEAWKHLDLLCHNYVLNVAAIIEKLTPSWVEFKNYLKHKRKEMSIEDLVVRLLIEEDNKLAQKNTYTPYSTKANMIEHAGSSSNSNSKEKGKGKKKNDKKGKAKAEYLTPKAGIVKPKFQGTCYNCDQPGHRAANYKMPMRVNPRQANMVNDNMNMIAMVSDVLVMISKVNLVGSNNSSWWVDTRATRHVCADKSMFYSFREVDNGEKLYMGNSATADIKGEGDVILKITSKKELKLINVLYVPEIRKYLVSGWLLNKFVFLLVLSLIRFPAQSIRSSDAIAIDSPTCLFSLPERLKADSTNLASHISQSCLMLTLEGFSFITVNTKEYHSECSGNYHKDNA
nr:hypothetical protein [Tanacetum cinerariifolium]